MKKAKREKMMKILIYFIVFIFIAGIIPMLFGM